MDRQEMSQSEVCVLFFSHQTAPLPTVDRLAA